MLSFLVKACKDVFPPSELHAQLIKPIQRVCRYPLLLSQLVKVTETSAPHYDELRKGQEASERVARRVNEALRRSENELAVVDLNERVEDWKDHHINGFGHLLLKDVFYVIKGESEREYHVYLFDKIILCCKEIGSGGRKNSRAAAKRQSNKTTKDLQLKGRIFINNVNETEPVLKNGAFTDQIAGYVLIGFGQTGSYQLRVEWKGETGIEMFHIKCRTEETLRIWHKTIQKAVEDALVARQRRSMNQNQRRIASPQSQFPNTPMSEFGTPSGYPSSIAEHRHGSMPSASTSRNVFDEEHGDYFDALDSRATARRLANTQSLPAGPRGDASTSARPRAQTEDASSAVYNQWRHQNGPTVPNMPRGASISSTASDMSSQAGSLRSSTSSRALRSKQSHDWGSAGFSPNRAYDDEYARVSDNGRTIIARNGSQASLPSHVYAAAQASAAVAPPILRSRSASSPHVYQMPMMRTGSSTSDSYPGNAHVPHVPPLNLLTKGKGNMTSATLHSSASASTNDDARRFSQSSMDSHRSSGDSSQSQSYTNITSPSSAAGMSSASLPFMAQRKYSGEAVAVRIKVRFGKDAYVIAVLSSITYQELADKVAKKIRLCGDQSQLDETALRIRYEDEEGDKILISSDEDILLAFEGARTSQASGGPVLTVYVD